MKKIMYTRPDGGLTVVIPAPKESIERSLGRYSDGQIILFKAYVRSAIGVFPLKIKTDLGTVVLQDFDSIEEIISAEIENIPDDKRPFTQDEYDAHVWDRSIPSDAINPRYVDDANIPLNREFRNAWCDITPDPVVDISLVDAKEIQLTKLRAERQINFEELGFPIRLNAEVEAAILSTETKNKLKALRDATEPLKALTVEGYNNEAVLDQIRKLGTLNV